jgi:hypothetical protein
MVGSFLLATTSTFTFTFKVITSWNQGRCRCRRRHHVTKKKIRYPGLLLLLLRLSCCLTPLYLSNWIYPFAHAKPIFYLLLRIFSLDVMCQLASKLLLWALPEYRRRIYSRIPPRTATTAGVAKDWFGSGCFTKLREERKGTLGDGNVFSLFFFFFFFFPPFDGVILGELLMHSSVFFFGFGFAFASVCVFVLFMDLVCSPFFLERGKNDKVCRAYYLI